MAELDTIIATRSAALREFAAEQDTLHADLAQHFGGGDSSLINVALHRGVRLAAVATALLARRSTAPPSLSPD